MKIFVASFNRASDGAISKLAKELDKENMLWDYGVHHTMQGKPTLKNIRADYILACGDRKETFEFCLVAYGKIPIIHLWAGEVSQGTHDEIYRWAITQMSMMALCTNDKAADRVNDFYNALRDEYGLGRSGSIRVVGNVMLDNMPPLEYDVVLYNPPSIDARPYHSCYCDSNIVEGECNQICEMLDETYFWIAPNGDDGSDIVNRYVNTPNLGRPQFLALVKNCRKFISNSSCIDYEIKHILKPEQIVRIGERNKARESMTSDMTIPDATKNIIEILKGLE